MENHRFKTYLIRTLYGQILIWKITISTHIPSKPCPANTISCALKLTKTLHGKRTFQDICNKALLSKHFIMCLTNKTNLRMENDQSRVITW
jgi:hypothetical protein